MTVTNTQVGIIRTGDGTVKVFDFSFRIALSSEVRVAKIISSTETLDYAGNLYSVARSSNGLGGTLTFVTAPEPGQKIYIYRDTELTQQVGLTSQQRYDPKVTEGVWDLLTLMLQELREKIGRAVLSTPGENPTDILSDLLSYATDAAASASSASVSAQNALASALSAASKELSMFRPRGNWEPIIYYSPSDIVYVSGSSYYCTAAHFSVNFATDLAAGRWFILAQQGAAGAGTGDMQKAELLSGLSNYGQARSNLGLGLLAVLNSVSLSMIDPAAIITDTETLALNKVPNAFPTAKAVTDYVDQFTRVEAPLGEFEWTTNVTTIPFTDLAEWESVEVSGYLNTLGAIKLQVSNDNGVTWRTAGYVGGVIEGANSVASVDAFGLTIVVLVNVAAKFSFIIDDMANPLRRTSCASQGSRANFVNMVGSGFYNTPEVCNALRIVGGTFSGGYAQVRGIRKVYVKPPPAELLYFDFDPLDFNGDPLTFIAG